MTTTTKAQRKHKITDCKFGCTFIKLASWVKHLESKSNAMLQKICTTHISVPGFTSLKYQKSLWINKTNYIINKWANYSSFSHSVLQY